METANKLARFSGREFTQDELSLMREVVHDFTNLTRTELSKTLCELLDWKRPNGELKNHECRNFLEKLATQGFLRLPEKKKTRPTNLPSFKAKPIESAINLSDLTGNVGDYAPLEIYQVKTKADLTLFQGLIQRYHYLGYTNPYGARLQYLIYVNRPEHTPIACIQFSSPAWRMQARDQWIGWDDKTREKNLQHVVNNSRFLVLGRIRNLASMILSNVLKRVNEDWKERYGLQPYLVETLIDSQRFHGGCYRAANWKVVGETSGRGRMDRAHERHDECIKTVMLYPLVKNAAERLQNNGRVCK